MSPDAWWVLATGSLFAGTHVLFGFPPLRHRLAARWGEARFVAAFAMLAAIGLAAMAFALATAGAAGAGPGAGLAPWMRAALAALAFAGLVLALAALRSYPSSPSALFRQGARPPRGIEKLSRHGFFVGFGTFALAHALLAHAAAPAIAFATFAGLSAIGALFQDRKLRQRHGEGYAAYMAQTSVLPGLALLRGRVRVQPEDRLGATLGGAVAGAALLGALHPVLAMAHGAPFVALLAAGGVYLSLRRWWSARRRLGAGMPVVTPEAATAGPAPSAPAAAPPGP
jgi:uncharacterized membrane protein